MKKIIKALIVLMTLVSIIAIAYMVVLFPKHEYRANTSVDKSFDLNDMLKESIPKNLSIANRKAKTTVSLTQDEIRTLILPEINKDGNIDGVEVSIEDNKMAIYMKQKVGKYFPTEVSLIFESEIEDDEVKLVLKDAKLGKINLDKEMVLNNFKGNDIKFFDVRPEDNEIILEDKQLKDIIKVNGVRLEDQKAAADIGIELNNMDDLMKLMELIKKQ